MLEKFKYGGGQTLERTETHLFFRPHPALRPFIAHYTLLFSTAEAALPSSLTLVPDASGCLVFSCGKSGVSGMFWGATTRAVVVGGGPETDLKLFVEFLPFGACQLLGMPQVGLSDCRIPLAEIFPETQQAVCDCLEKALDQPGLIRELDKWFLHFLPAIQEEPGAKLLPFLENGDVWSVRRLSAITFYSERQLGRFFGESMGIGIKAYSRLWRINKALRRMQDPTLLLTALAQELGYYDQSHFIHDFKTVCGVSPSIYLQNMSDFYKESFKF